MSKYIDADLLKSKLKDVATEFKTGNYYLDNSEQTVGYENALIDFEQIVDSLQQEMPEVDFKIEERKWVYDAVDNIFPEDGDFMSEVDFRKIIKDTARHFYELGLKVRKEE